MPKTAAFSLGRNVSTSLLEIDGRADVVREHRITGPLIDRNRGVFLNRHVFSFLVLLLYQEVDSRPQTCDESFVDWGMRAFQFLPNIGRVRLPAFAKSLDSVDGQVANRRDPADREVTIQCQTFRQAEAATAVYNETHLLLKSQRACLAKYEQTPDRAKEYCSEYSRAQRCRPSNLASARTASVS